VNDVEFDGLDLRSLGGGPFGTVLADPPWRFINRTGKVAPEHRRLSRYDTLSWKEIASMPVADVMDQQSHCYLWVPNALVAEGLAVLEAWGFTYKTMLVWAKRRKDGGPDGRGVGFYFRNVTEPVLFGVRGHLRTLAPGRRQVNMIETLKREHSRKPDELYRSPRTPVPGVWRPCRARPARALLETERSDRDSQERTPSGIATLHHRQKLLKVRGGRRAELRLGAHADRQFAHLVLGPRHQDGTVDDGVLVEHPV
jgi:N6-adenosine-specific RNA methylase IME4